MSVGTRHRSTVPNELGTGLAVDVYVHGLRFHIGAMLGALGGLDARRNASLTGDVDVAADGSRVRVPVIRAEEEWAIARAAAALVAARGRVALAAVPS